MIKGNDILVQMDGVNIAACKSCDIIEDCDAIEVASPTSGTARDYIAGRTGWKITVNYLVAESTTAFKSKMKAGTSCVIKIGKATSGTRTLSSDKLQGNALITEARLSSSRGKLCQGSWTFLGCGELS